MQSASTNLSSLTIVWALVGKHDIYVGIRWASKEQDFRNLTLSGERYVGVMAIREKKTSGKYRY